MKKYICHLLNQITLFVIIFNSGFVYADGSLEIYPTKESAAQFELEDLHNNIHRLSDYQGKVVLVNFWASWCSACLKEIPSMTHLQQTFQNRPFEIVAINVSEQKRRVSYQAEHIFKMTFTVLLDSEGKTFKQWQAKILPTSFIINRKGQIRYLAQGALEWDSDEISSIIEKLLIE